MNRFASTADVGKDFAGISVVLRGHRERCRWRGAGIRYDRAGEAGDNLAMGQTIRHGEIAGAVAGAAADRCTIGPYREERIRQPGQ
jgi:hypothetical protein